MTSEQTQTVPANALSRRCVLATDIEKYGIRTAPDQLEAQRAYAVAMGVAAAEAGLSREDWITQAAGDGELVVLPDGVYETRVVGVFLPALATWLRDYNRSRDPDHRVRLRVAVHVGLIHLDGATGYPGTSVVKVCRLLNADVLRSVLRQLPSTNLAAIVSAAIYQDVVMNHYEGARPELFQQVTVDDPAKGFRATAWIHAPEADVTKMVFVRHARLWMAIGGMASLVALLAGLSVFMIR